jgi:hypothetical protein
MVPIIIDDFSVVIGMRTSIPTKNSHLTPVKYDLFKLIGQSVIKYAPPPNERLRNEKMATVNAMAMASVRRFFMNSVDTTC